MFNRNILAQIAIELSIISMVANGQRFISRYECQILKCLKYILMLRRNIFIIYKNQSDLNLIIEPSWMNFDFEIRLLKAIPSLFRLEKIDTFELNRIKYFQGSTADESILTCLSTCNCKIMIFMLKLNSLFII